MLNAHITAVMVTYHPDLERTTDNLNALLPQVGSVVMVDNGSPTDLAAWASANFPMVHVIRLGGNKGIAAAQNAGIAWAKTQHADGVLLMDHDSKPAPDMVAKLWAAYEKLESNGQRTAAVAPQVYDENRNESLPFYQTRGLSKKLRWCTPGDETIVADSVIASGCLIPMRVLVEIGDMRADFFIDYVDTEWCLRAQNFGYRVYAVCSAQLFHKLGEKTKYFMGKKIPLHRTERYYYMYRNRTYMTLYLGGWKILDGIALMRRYVFFSLFVPPRFDNWLAMTRGIWDGIIRRMGAYPGTRDAP